MDRIETIHNIRRFELALEPAISFGANQELVEDVAKLVKVARSKLMENLLRGALLRADEQVRDHAVARSVEVRRGADGPLICITPKGNYSIGGVTAQFDTFFFKIERGNIVPLQSDDLSRTRGLDRILQAVKEDPRFAELIA